MKISTVESRAFDTLNSRGLSKEKASAIMKHVVATGKLCPDGQTRLTLPVKNSKTGVYEDFEFSTHTIRLWFHMNRTVRGVTDKGLCDMWHEARNKFKMGRKAQEDKELLRMARAGLAQVMGMNTDATGGFVGISSRRDPKTGKIVETNRYKQMSVGTDSMKLKEKIGAFKLVLERLDPAFKKQEAGATVNVNLSFLKLADTEDEMIRMGKITNI